MSLFGNLGGQPASSAPGSSTSAPPFKSLFGGTTASSTAPPSGGLFSGLGGQSSAQPAASQPASTGGGLGGLFGAKPATPATTGASGFALGSFGGASTSQAQSKPAFPSLFSTSTSQAPQQSTTTNPLSNPQQTTAAPLGSLFSTSAAPQAHAQAQAQAQQQPRQQQSGLLSQSNGGAGRTAHFDHLLERGRKRNAGENGLNSFDELPSLQLGLGDIARKVRNLGAGGPSADQAQERAAYVFTLVAT